jgi:hypothetical protein
MEMRQHMRRIISAAPKGSTTRVSAALKGWPTGISAAALKGWPTGVSAAALKGWTTGVVALALVATVAGCSLRTTVADLKYNPGRYHDRTVSIDGVVTSSWSVPLVPFRFYKVDDGTGEVTVISQRGRGTVSKGARVRVKGKVGDVANFGGQAIGLHLQERDVDFKDR